MEEKSQYELCIGSAIAILHELREDHKLISPAITANNLLLYIGSDTKLLTPGRSKQYSAKRYERLYNELQDVKPSLFYKWLVK